MGTNTERERRTDLAAGQLTENDLIRIKDKANVTEKLIQSLDPFFEELKRVIHDKWEALSLEDGGSAKLLHFQLRTVSELQRLMKSKITQGKQAAKKLEGV